MTKKCYYRPAVMFIVVFLLSSVLTLQASSQVNLHVATDGFDYNPGTADKPFATLEKARDAVRKIKAKGKLTAPVVVWLRDGTYTLSQPFALEAKDSGTLEAPVIYRAYPGEEVLISGGRKIDGWKKTHGKLWTAQLPEVKKGNWHFRQLFVNDKRATRARTPNTGCFNLTGLVNAENRKDPANRKGFRFKAGDLKSSWTNVGDIEVIKLFSWGETRLPIDAIDEGAGIVTFTGSTGPGREFDLGRLFDWAGTRYYAENIFEALDSPGEWYLNRKTGVVYYWPLAGEDMSKAQIVAPVLEKLIELKGDVDARKFVEYVTFQGLTLAHSNWTLPATGYSETQAAIHVTGENPSSGRPVGAINAIGALNCSLIDNDIKHIGGYAIELDRGCKDNNILGNRIHDLGGGGIKVGERLVIEPADDLSKSVRPGKPLDEYINIDGHHSYIVPKPEQDIDEAGGTTIADNYIYDGGKVYLGAVGIHIAYSSGNVVSHNEIFNFNYSGMSVGFTWGCSPNRTKNNIVEYNYIHDLLKGYLNDGGGIYLLGVSPGTIIRNNLIHDVISSGHLGRGIYFDEGSSSITVRNNIVYNTINSICFGDGRNLIENNIFANASVTQVWISAGAKRKCFPERDTFRKNIVYYNDPATSLFTFYQVAAEDMGKVLKLGDHNIYWLEGGGEMFVGDWGIGNKPVLDFEQWKELGFDNNSIVADPMFVDAANNNYDLKPNSPALKLGFKPIDISTVGPRPKQR